MAVLRVVVDYGIPFIVILSILVFVHEFGHYLLARWAGVRVEVFSIGFGREIRGWTDRRGTRWKISWIPLGGYVKMLGEGDDEEADRSGIPEDSFAAKTVRQRAAIIAAGPLFNFFFAVVLFAALFSLVGRPNLQAAVGHVEAGSPAAAAGFQIGDRIVSVAGHPIVWFDDLKNEVSRLPGVKAVFEVVRGDSTVAIEATPAPVTVAAGDGRSLTIGRLGLGPNPSQVGYIRLDPLSAAGTAIDRSLNMTVQIFSYLGGVITGSQPANELGGPIRIAQMSGEMAQAGLFELVFFMAVLSLNLALINVLPIPMLDGGHLVFLAAEAIRGRPVTPRVQEYSFRFGLILVLLVLVFATWNDLGEIHLFE
jgi:regulator of sigma E protease